MARLRPPHLARIAVAATVTLAAFSLAAAARAATFLEVAGYPANELHVVGFELPRAASIDIDAVGARPRGDDDLVVYGWILNAATREVVWSEQRGRKERRGSSHALRRTQDTVEFPAGRYELYTWAGARSPVRWSWGDDFFGRHGIVITYGRSNDDVHEIEEALPDCHVKLQSAALTKDDVRQFEPTGEIPGALYRATQLADNACVQAAFTLDRDASLRVYCVGEIPADADAFADGAWIVNATTRERVWELRRRQTRQAGGADKNRLCDDTVHLAAGRYIVVAGTDGSHACKEWNGAPPDDPLNWGITLLPGKDFAATTFHLEPSPSRGEPLLVMNHVGNGESVERRFRLASAATLQIYAAGEMSGEWDEFADRGWITKAASGETVWDMNERNTHPAGGAQKNRLFDGSLQLPAGDYVAHYETDDSHAYDTWNADAPFDREAWGLAIYAAPGMGRGAFTVLEPAPDHAGRASGGAHTPGTTLADLTEVGDDQDVQTSFTLAAPARVHIYAVGEGLDRDMYDYGWIEDSAGKTVWEMTMRNTRHAGGARKNRAFDDDVMLDAGRYVVHFQTDGSHAYGDWNDRRPSDPRAWGIAVTLAEPKEKTTLH